jgi:hypothetical protein
MTLPTTPFFALEDFDAVGTMSFLVYPPEEWSKAIFDHHRKPFIFITSRVRWRYYDVFARYAHRAVDAVNTAASSATAHFQRYSLSFAATFRFDSFATANPHRYPDRWHGNDSVVC